jgi:hypothetical protein
MRHAFDNQSHFTFQNVNDLLLRVRVRRHSTTRCEGSEHLVHIFAVCDGPARDSRANFNRRIFYFHGWNLTLVHFAREFLKRSPCSLFSRRSRFGKKGFPLANPARNNPRKRWSTAENFKSVTK